MARKQSPHLTESELPIMQVLWEQGAKTVAEVVDALPHDPPPAYSTVLTTLRILEQKGYVEHTKTGRAFVYEPIVDRQNASRDALRFVVSRFFTGSASELVQNLIESEDISSKELQRLKQLIAESPEHSEEEGKAHDRH
jgi:predicted transcriptional regulator